jgi:hypothetical protein
LVELRHALAVVVGHFEVNDRVHFAHDGPPCRWFETFEETPDLSQCGRFPLPEGAPALDRLGRNVPLMAEAQHGLAFILVADTPSSPASRRQGSSANAPFVRPAHCPGGGMAMSTARIILHPGIDK